MARIVHKAIWYRVATVLMLLNLMPLPSNLQKCIITYIYKYIGWHPTTQTVHKVFNTWHNSNLYSCICDATNWSIIRGGVWWSPRQFAILVTFRSKIVTSRLYRDVLQSRLPSPDPQIRTACFITVALCIKTLRTVVS